MINFTMKFCTLKVLEILDCNVFNDFRIEDKKSRFAEAEDSNHHVHIFVRFVQIIKIINNVPLSIHLSRQVSENSF